MNIDELKALSDDALIEKVGREVMGWRGIPQCWVTQIEPRTQDYWSPLHNWNHTMEVVAKAKQSRFEFYICWYDSKVDISISTEGDPVNFKDDCDPRRAICIAALLAVSSK